MSWRSNTAVHYCISAFEINQAYYFDGFSSQTIEGLQRRGKTAYACKSFANAFGEWEFKPYPHVTKPDFESVKNWLTFMPKEYLDVIMDVDEKVRGCILDDAGLWLYALDWYDPFVKAVNKWLQVCGTRFGTVYLTTPNKSLISSKVLDALPEMRVCRVEKNGIDSLRNRPRLAKVYERWDYPDGKKGGVKTLYEDKFNAMLPDDFYAWYKPKRDSYLDLALQLLQTEVVKLNKLMQMKGVPLSDEEKMKLAEKDDAMNIVDKALGGDTELLEVGEVLKMLEVDQIRRSKKA